MSMVLPSLEENIEAIGSADPSGEEIYKLTWDLLRVFDGDEIESQLLERAQGYGLHKNAHIAALMHLGGHRSFFRKETIDYFLQMIRKAEPTESVENAVRALLGKQLWNLPGDTYFHLRDVAAEIMRGTGWSRSSTLLARAGFGFVESRVRAHQALEAGRIVVPIEFAERLVRRATNELDAGFCALGYEGKAGILRNLLGFSAELRKGTQSEFAVAGVNGLYGRVCVRWSLLPDERLLSTAASAEVLGHW